MTNQISCLFESRFRWNSERKHKKYEKIVFLKQHKLSKITNTVNECSEPNKLQKMSFTSNLFDRFVWRYLLCSYVAYMNGTYVNLKIVRFGRKRLRIRVRLTKSKYTAIYHFSQLKIRFQCKVQKNKMFHFIFHVLYITWIVSDNFKIRIFIWKQNNYIF